MEQMEACEHETLDDCMQVKVLVLAQSHKTAPKQGRQSRNQRSLSVRKRRLAAAASANLWVCWSLCLIRCDKALVFKASALLILTLSVSKLLEFICCLYSACYPGSTACPMNHLLSFQSHAGRQALLRTFDFSFCFKKLELGSILRHVQGSDRQQDRQA